MINRKLKQKIQNELTLIDIATKEVDSLKILQTRTVGGIEGVENTHLLSQEEIKRNIKQITAEKVFNIDLEKGPFFTNYTKNGRHMLIRNNKGFLGSFDVKLLKLHFEIDVKEKVKDAKFLHNECFLAVAQKNNVFIYNNEGTEIQCIRDNRDVFRMEYLFYHFLLCTLSHTRFLRYQDVSTGKMVAEISLKEEFCSMKSNKENAIIHLGNEDGVISLWSPNSKEYLMKVSCHKSRIKNIEIDKFGNYMLTASTDRILKVWDLRNSFKPVKSFVVPHDISYSDLSDNGCLAIGSRNHLYVYKDIFSDSKLYLENRFSSPVSDLSFCPYEDILTVGHSCGISNMIVPGCGDPYFDSFEDNPFETKAERKNKEVKRLLEKIPFEFIGTKMFEFKEKQDLIENNNLEQSSASNRKRTALDRFYRK